MILTDFKRHFICTTAFKWFFISTTTAWLTDFKTTLLLLPLQDCDRFFNNLLLVRLLLQECNDETTFCQHFTARVWQIFALVLLVLLLLLQDYDRFLNNCKTDRFLKNLLLVLLLLQNWQISKRLFICTTITARQIFKRPFISTTITARLTDF